MSEQHKKFEGQDEPEHASLLSEIKKIQQHLGFLEKKIDMLVGGQTGGGSGRPFNKERSFSRPPRPFGHSGGPRRHDGPPRGDRPSFGGGGRFEKKRFGGGDRDRSSSGGDRGPRKEGGDFPRRKKHWHDS